MGISTISLRPLGSGPNVTRLKLGRKRRAPSTITQQMPLKRARNYNTRQQERDLRPPRLCVYCDHDHNSVDCQQYLTTDDRRRKLSEKQLCFNCTGQGHRAIDCKSRTGCKICQRRHHTSICNNGRANKEPARLLTATRNEKGTGHVPCRS